MSNKLPSARETRSTARPRGFEAHRESSATGAACRPGRAVGPVATGDLLARQAGQPNEGIVDVDHAAAPRSTAPSESMLPSKMGGTSAPAPAVRQAHSWRSVCRVRTRPGTCGRPSIVAGFSRTSSMQAAVLAAAAPLEGGQRFGLASWINPSQRIVRRVGACRRNFGYRQVGEFLARPAEGLTGAAVATRGCVRCPVVDEDCILGPLEDCAVAWPRSAPAPRWRPTLDLGRQRARERSEHRLGPFELPNGRRDVTARMPSGWPPEPSGGSPSGALDALRPRVLVEWDRCLNPGGKARKHWPRTALAGCAGKG